jgi:hypothetical protein
MLRHEICCRAKRVSRCFISFITSNILTACSLQPPVHCLTQITDAKATVPIYKHLHSDLIYYFKSDNVCWTVHWWTAWNCTVYAIQISVLVAEKYRLPQLMYIKSILMLFLHPLLGLPSRRFVKVDCGLLGCDTVQFHRCLLTFRRNIPPSVFGNHEKVTQRHNSKHPIDNFT